MTTMTESQMEDHIKSNSWHSVRTVRQGSEDYNSNIGLLRVLFGVSDDPVEVTTLFTKGKPEVWGHFEQEWRKLF